MSRKSGPPESSESRFMNLQPGPQTTHTRRISFKVMRMDYLLKLNVGVTVDNNIIYRHLYKHVSIYIYVCVCVTVCVCNNHISMKKQFRLTYLFLAEIANFEGFGFRSPTGGISITKSTRFHQKGW